ncbi:MAG: signal peptidase I [Theionarchaea archaeon]|nr:signal peptidase I [Theionarchaea archaeon]
MDWKNELREIGEGIIIAVLLYLVIQASFMVTMGVEKPLYVVISGSMEPTYEEGDILIVKSVEVEDISEGDIIVFDPPFGGIPIVHRVFKVVESNGNRYFITKGDNNPFPDPYFQETYPGIPKEHIIGKPFIKIPKLGLFQIWARQLFHVIRCPSLQLT